MPRYRYIGTEQRSFPALGLDLEPGQEFETDQPVEHPDIQPIDEASKANVEPDAPTVAEE